MDRSNIVQQAVDKRDGLADLLKGKEDAEEPICCHIVSGGSGQGGGTKAALEIWDILTAAGVAAKDIAVHVTNGKKAADADSVSRPGFTDTYLLNLSPSEIRESGFKHIIWNKALREGWDEPWAFVAYIEGRNQSSVDIQQKIGRLLRNPFRNILGQPTVAKDDELGSCYFFLEEDNIRFAELLKAVQLDMQAEYSPLIEVTKKSLVYRELLPKEHLSLTKYKVVPDQMALREKLEKCIRCPKEEDRFASGEVAKGSIDLASGETTQSNVTQSASMVQISISHLVSELLRERDPRLVRGWLDDDVWDNETMSMKLAYRSTAYGQVTSDVTSFLEAVPNLLSMTESKLRWELGSSKIVDGADKRSRSIAPTTAYHEEYDGLNDLEYEVALTLDDANCKWFRNPVQKGYCVEMRRAVRGSSLFFPDFVAVKNDKIFLVEPKGEHLLIEAKLSKLFDLPNNKIQIYLLSANGSDRAIHTVSGTQNFGSTKEAIAWMFGHST